MTGRNMRSNRNRKTFKVENMHANMNEERERMANYLNIGIVSYMDDSIENFEDGRYAGVDVYIEKSAQSYRTASISLGSSKALINAVETGTIKKIPVINTKAEKFEEIFSNNDRYAVQLVFKVDYQMNVAKDGSSKFLFL